MQAGYKSAISPTGPKDRVTICHETGRGNARRLTLTVSHAALDAHLRHGDSRGPCDD